MAKEEKDLSKLAKEEKDLPEFEWKTMQEPVANASGEGVSAKERPRKRLRQIPEYYFLPRRSLTFNLLFYGGCIVGGIGAGMLIEKWIDKKVKEDGGVIWEFDK